MLGVSWGSLRVIGGSLEVAGEGPLALLGSRGGPWDVAGRVLGVPGGSLGVPGGFPGRPQALLGEAWEASKTHEVF